MACFPTPILSDREYKQLRRSFEAGLSFDKFTMHCLNYGPFSCKLASNLPSDAIEVTYLYLRLRHRVLANYDMPQGEGTVGTIGELLAPFIVDSLEQMSETDARANFTRVMKNALITKCYLEYSSMTDDIYSSLPAYGTTAESVLGVSETKLENFERIPFGIEPGLTFENLYQFLVLCARCPKVDVRKVRMNVIGSLLLALCKTGGWGGLDRQLNNVALAEVGVDPEIKKDHVTLIQNHIVSEIDRATLVSECQRWSALLPESAVRYKLMLEHAASS